MLACISSATLTGALVQPVSVEIHVSNGLPGFTIVGLPEAAVRESRDQLERCRGIRQGDHARDMAQRAVEAELATDCERARAVRGELTRGHQHPHGDGHAAHGVSSLAELAQILRARTDWPDIPPAQSAPAPPDIPDLSDVRGQALGRHVLEVAAVERSITWDGAKFQLEHAQVFTSPAQCLQPI